VKTAALGGPMSIPSIVTTGKRVPQHVRGRRGPRAPLPARSDVVLVQGLERSPDLHVERGKSGERHPADLVAHSGRSAPAAGLMKSQ
jgi:hypothetical protein